VLFPNIGGGAIGAILGGGAVLGGIAFALVARKERKPGSALAPLAWRAPSLEALEPLRLTPARRLWMLVLRGYLVVAVAMVIVRVIQTV
jgi:hypothetical protein